MKINKWPWVAVALCLTLAGPIAGAMSTLTWSYAADGNDPQRIATETYERVMKFSYGPTHRDYRERRRHYLRGDIVIPNRACAEQMRTSHEVAAGDIQSALDTYRIERLRNQFDEPAIDALASLPAPLLGGLAACINQSVLSGLCARRVVVIADSANRKATDMLLRERVAINRSTEAMWCAIGSG